MRYVLILVAVTLVGGCVTAAQRQHTRMNSIIREAFAHLQTCHKAARQMESAKALAPKVWLPGGEPPLSYFTNDKYPTDADLRNIDSAAQKFLQCDSETKTMLASAHPSFSIIYGDYINVKRMLILGLLRKQMTYGEFNKAFNNLAQILERVWTQNAAQVNAQLSYQNSIELAQRRAAIQAFAAGLQRAAASMPKPPPSTSQSHLPITTNCYAIGVGVQCTTW